MATATSDTSKSSEARAPLGSVTPLVVVDLGEPQSHATVKRLCKGKGSLFTHVDQIVKDLIADGTVKADAQPVVIVVREFPMPPWLMGHDD
jgi:hypothetical protein